MGQAYVNLFLSEHNPGEYVTRNIIPMIGLGLYDREVKRSQPRIVINIGHRSGAYFVLVLCCVQYAGPQKITFTDLVERLGWASDLRKTVKKNVSESETAWLLTGILLMLKGRNVGF